MNHTPIRSILIANRGEIASRIILTCREMGIRSICVYSDADEKAPYLRECDTAIRIGPAEPSMSYLNMEVIIEAAKRTKSDAIHPGYGFLSENGSFARMCKENNIIFIGPNAEAIDAMGSKSSAKKLMREHHVPVLAGYEGEDQSISRLQEEAKKIGFPVLIKATAGGGGKGMRVVDSEKDIIKAIESAQRESLNSFGNNQLILEKYISKARHIEFQIFGDQHENLVHMFERECTIQRRYQKIIEESPSSILDDQLRGQMAEAAIRAGRTLNYDNAGTVEFIYDEEQKSFYFLEINTRLQVEHPVTEAITGLDLVKLQIGVAEGRVLPMKQEEIKCHGYAIEARLYAEDPSNDFLPMPGQISLWQAPEFDGLRIDTAVESNAIVPVYYDPLIAKIIVTDENRLSTINKLSYALNHLKCLGLKTNRDFLIRLLELDEFKRGHYDTHFINNNLELFSTNSVSDECKLIAAIVLTIYDWVKRKNKRKLLTHLPSGWRNNPYCGQQVSYKYHNETIELTYSVNGDQFNFDSKSRKIKVKLLMTEKFNIRISINDQQFAFDICERHNECYIYGLGFPDLILNRNARFTSGASNKSKGTYESVMPSVVIKCLVERGQQISLGEELIVLNSMKMEMSIKADENGIVEEVYVKEGQHIESGVKLIKINAIRQE